MFGKILEPVGVIEVDVDFSLGVSVVIGMSCDVACW